MNIFKYNLIKYRYLYIQNIERVGVASDITGMCSLCKDEKQMIFIQHKKLTIPFPFLSN